MPQIFPAVVFFALAVIINFVNAYIIYSKGTKGLDPDSELIEGYKKLAYFFAFVFNIPFIIMLVGCLSGNVTDMLDFFKPWQMNPYVVGFYVGALVIYLYILYFIFFQGGAEFLIKHRNLLTKVQVLNSEIQLTESMIKVFSVVMVIFGISIMAILWLNVFQLPN